MGGEGHCYSKLLGSKMALSKEYNMSLVGTASPTTGGWLCWFYLAQGLLEGFAATKACMAYIETHPSAGGGVALKDLLLVPFFTLLLDMEMRLQERECNGVSKRPS